MNMKIAPRQCWFCSSWRSRQSVRNVQLGLWLGKSPTRCNDVILNCSGLVFACFAVWNIQKVRTLSRCYTWTGADTLPQLLSGCRCFCQSAVMFWWIHSNSVAVVNSEFSYAWMFLTPVWNQDGQQDRNQLINQSEFLKQYSRDFMWLIPSYYRIIGFILIGDFLESYSIK